jgi:hypothetical protein
VEWIIRIAGWTRGHRLELNEDSNQAYVDRKECSLGGRCQDQAMLQVARRLRYRSTRPFLDCLESKVVRP